MKSLEKQKLHENLFSCCRGVDRFDAGLIRSTYWPDSTDDHGVYVGPGLKWAETGFAWKDKVLSNNHRVSNVLIEINGNQAKRERMFMNMVNMKEPALSCFLGGHYRDLCEKRNGELKILNRLCIWDCFEHYPTIGSWQLCGVPRTSSYGHFYPRILSTVIGMRVVIARSRAKQISMLLRAVVGSK
ncbi:hypothetical protein NX059_011079 [Plenodomus lindquistii]|nr:hypothetical protein NX059_011079 [Plenodomus lindquistii]